VAHAFANWKPLPVGKTSDVLELLLAVIGATVTPWMLFFQQSATVDKGLTRQDIRFGRTDTIIGAALAALAAVATILATTPLFKHQMNAADFQAAEFAQALQPFIGHAGAALFALGIVEAGIIASITISISSAYAFAEVAHTPHSLNLPIKEGRAFYSVLFICAAAAAGIVLIPGLPLVPDRRTRDASGAGIFVHACERPRNYGRFDQPDVGQRARDGRGADSDRRRSLVWHQYFSAQRFEYFRRKLGRWRGWLPTNTMKSK
jgi:hypothetical protein